MPLLWPQNWLTPSMINSRLICSPIHFLVPFKKILRHACSLSSWNVGPTFHFNSIFLGRCSSLENSGGWGQTRIAADCNNFRNQGLNKRKLSKNRTKQEEAEGPIPNVVFFSLSPLPTAPHTHGLRTSHLQRFHRRISKPKERKLCEAVVYRLQN